MQEKSKQNLDEKVKALPIEDQNYIKGWLDGALKSVAKKISVKQLEEQPQ